MTAKDMEAADKPGSDGFRALAIKVLFKLA